MPEVTVTIGGSDFQVACHDGEEHFLETAAAMLDNEAAALKDALGRMPESRMLLMAGLMLADKTASLEDKLKAAETDDPGTAKRLARMERQLTAAQSALAEGKVKLAEAEAEAAKADTRAAEAQAKSGDDDQLQSLKADLDAARAEADAAKAALQRCVEKIEKSAG